MGRSGASGSGTKEPPQKRKKTVVGDPAPEQQQEYVELHVAHDDWINYCLNDPNHRPHMQKRLEKQVHPCKSWNFSPLEEAGELEPIRALLRHEYYHRGTSQRYVLEDWEDLFFIQEIVHPLLTREFLATLHVKFTDRTSKSYMKFRLGGENRSMTMLQFAHTLGIYQGLPVQVLKDYLAQCVIPAPDFSYSEAWGRISNEPFRPSKITASKITDSRVRCLQRLIANTINFRKESNEKISQLDIWFIDMILKRQHVHLPHMILSHLWDDKGEKAKSPSVGGHFVTILARHFSINTAGLERMPMPEFGRRDYINGKILKLGSNQLLRRYDDGAGSSTAEAEEEDEEMPQEYGPDQPGLLDVMSRLGNMELNFNDRFTQVNSRLDNMARDIAAIRYDQAWSNYRGDWQHHHYQSSMPPAQDPMDISYQYPQYYADPSHPPSAPVFPYPFQGQPSSNPSYHDQQYQYDQQRHHDQSGQGGPS